jgi:hypothetical protein
MRDHKAIQIIAVVVTVGAVAAMALVGGSGFGAEGNPVLPRAVGGELARQALSFHRSGGQIMVITRDTTAFENPASDFLLEGFERELQRAHVGIDTLQRIQVDPLRMVEVPSGDFQNWIHHATAGDVIVSFMGPPLFTPEQRQQLGDISAAVVAFCPGNWPERVDFRALLAGGVLRAAVVARDNPSPAAMKSSRFDERFEVVTPANVEGFMAAVEKSNAPK